MSFKLLTLGICILACLFLVSSGPMIWVDPAPPMPADKVSGNVAPATGNWKHPVDKRIVFTANQGFLSRIYILRMDGSVERFFEYVNFRFVDLEVVDNELYAAEAFAPRVYKVDIYTGDLDVIIDDWSLYYFYGLAFDGTFFYLDEWNFRRYYKNGTFAGSTSFSNDFFGGAWDGTYLWALGKDDLVKCWDISSWPALNEVPSNHFTPPSPDCRGLYHDGTSFWSAESIEDKLGKIYRFDHQGQVISEWQAPAYTGWGACVISVRP